MWHASTTVSGSGSGVMADRNSRCNIEGQTGGRVEGVWDGGLGVVVGQGFPLQLPPLQESITSMQACQTHWNIPFMPVPRFPVPIIKGS